jgi:ATPase subunit of ABC transporter with duplicated ATPase domains
VSIPSSIPSSIPASAPVPTFALRARGLGADTGDRALFSNLDLTLGAHSRVGVVGPNGVGKSTLLRLLAGDAEPNEGSVERSPATATVALVPQEPDRSGESTRHFLGRRTGVTAAEHELTNAAAGLDEPSPAASDRYDAALARYLRLGCADFDERLGQTAAKVGLDARLLDRSTAALSGGEAARVSLAAVLLAQVDLLLLDEPTNDLDSAGLDMIEALVATSPSGMVIVSHDRVFLERTVETVVDLGEDGSTDIYDGGWEAYLDLRAAQRRQARDAYQRYDDRRRRLVDHAEQQRTWSHQGVRRSKRSGETDKFVRFGAQQGAQNSGQKAARTERELDRLEAVDKPWEGWDLRFSIATTGRAGTMVAEAREATVRRGATVLGPWTAEVTWGERLALTGPNGVGKTTLVDLLAGRLSPTTGTVHLGPSVVLGELRQQRLDIGASSDLLDWFLERSGQSISEGRSVLAKFGLSARHLARPPSSLSTGERTRAELALFQARGVNLLILDEPTNHLDLEAIEQLETALAGYEGTLIVVSHDRRFVEHLDLTRTTALG